MKAIAAALAVCTSFLAVSVLLAQSRDSEKPTVGREPEYDPAIYSELQKAPEKARNRANPFENNPDAVAAGAILFEQHCAECHANSAEGSQSPGSGGGNHHARNAFLAIDQWSGSKKDAGVVEASGASALAVGAVRQIAWRACSSPGTKFQETLTEQC